MLKLISVLIACTALSGCLAAAAVGAAVGVAGDVAEGAVKTTGAVVGGAVDQVTTSEKERSEKAEKEARKRPD
jgi:phage tail tape-measure protein